MVMRTEDKKSDAIIGQNKQEEGGIAQLARASALQAEGRRFESDYLHKKKRLCNILQGLFSVFTTLLNISTFSKIH